jgi:hypothetical protein
MSMLPEEIEDVLDQLERRAEVLEADVKYHNTVLLAHQGIQVKLSRRLQALEQGGKGLAEMPSGSSSAATAGTAERQSQWSTGRAESAPRVSLQADGRSLVLTVATGEVSRSTWYTLAEWEAIRIYFSTLQPTSESPTIFGSTLEEAGSPGHVGPELRWWDDASITDHTGVFERAAAVPDKALETEGERHGWIPNLLIDHDAPVCEVCEGLMEDHDGEALITQEFFKLRDALQAALDAFVRIVQTEEAAGRERLRDIASHAAYAVRVALGGRSDDGNQESAVATQSGSGDVPNTPSFEEWSAAQPQCECGHIRPNHRLGEWECMYSSCPCKAFDVPNTLANWGLPGLPWTKPEPPTPESVDVHARIFVGGDHGLNDQPERVEGRRWLHATTPAGDEYLVGPDRLAWHYGPLADYLNAIEARDADLESRTAFLENMYLEVRAIESEAAACDHELLVPVEDGHIGKPDEKYTYRDSLMAWCSKCGELGWGRGATKVALIPSTQSRKETP